MQAIARVNRPYEDDERRRKTAGFVLDFVGIFENLEDGATVANFLEWFPGVTRAPPPP